MADININMTLKFMANENGSIYLISDVNPNKSCDCGVTEKINSAYIDLCVE